MTGFWSPGNIWRGGIFLPINCNHRALMNDAALYQRLRRAPLISMWGRKKKNLLISGSEDMRAVFIRYYNGTLTQICGFSWEEVQSHLAWRMPLHVAHIFISHTHWVKVGHWHGLYMARPPSHPDSPTELALWSLNLNLEWGEAVQRAGALKSNQASDRSAMQTRAALQTNQPGEVYMTEQWWSNRGSVYNMIFDVFSVSNRFSLHGFMLPESVSRWRRTQFTVVHCKGPLVTSTAPKSQHHAQLMNDNTFFSWCYFKHLINLISSAWLMLS